MHNISNVHNKNSFHFNQLKIHNRKGVQETTQNRKLFFFDCLLEYIVEKMKTLLRLSIIHVFLKVFANKVMHTVLRYLQKKFYSMILCILGLSIKITPAFPFWLHLVISEADCYKVISPCIYVNSLQVKVQNVEHNKRK